MHLDFMPTILLNWAMKNLSGFIIDSIIQKSTNLPEKYTELKAEKKEFYATLQSRIDEISKPATTVPGAS